MDQRAQVDWQDRLLKDTTADGLCIIGSDGRVREVNQAYCQLLGYSKDELLGMNLAELDAADHPFRLKHHIDQAIASGGTRYVTSQRNKDGQPLDLEVALRYVDIDPEPYLLVSLCDLGKRIPAEEAHRESEERFRRAFDHAPIGMALVDLNERFMQVNRTLCEILGYTEEELLSTTVAAITHPDDRQADRGQCQKAGRCGPGHHGQTTVITSISARKDNRIRCSSLAIRVLSSSPAKTGGTNRICTILPNIAAAWSRLSAITRTPLCYVSVQESGRLDRFISGVDLGWCPIISQSRKIHKNRTLDNTKIRWYDLTNRSVRRRDVRNV